MPKGNPNPNEGTRFKTDRTESLTEKLMLRITPSMMDQIISMPDKNEFVREAIAEKLLTQAVDKADPI
jgi:hypothetical protein